MSGDAPFRLVVVASGEPDSPSTNSGVTYNLLRELRSRHDIRVVAAIDTSPSVIAKLVLAAATVSPNADKWKSAYRNGPLTSLYRSHRRDRALRRIRDDYDGVLHVRGVYLPIRHRPYFGFIDTTIEHSTREWPPWRMSRLWNFLAVRLESLFYDRAQCVFVASARVAAQLQFSNTAIKSKVVGAGVDQSIRRAAVNALSPRRAQNPTVQVLFVGREYERKGADLLVTAAGELHDEGLAFQVTLVGIRSDMPPTSGVSLIGRVGREKVAALYMNADIFCLPARFEPYGLVLHEAMLHGLPSIVSDVDSLPEIVGSGGIVIPANDLSALKKALSLLVQSRDLRNELGERAKAISMEANWSTVAARIANAIRAEGT